MSVLPGEGTHVILYGSLRIAARTQIHNGYLARPDLVGAYPTIVVVPDTAGVTSGIKDLARRLARHGLAVLALDLYRGDGPGRGDAEAAAAAYENLTDARALSDLGDIYRNLSAPGTDWADSSAIGLLGVGVGGRLAILSAADNNAIAAVAVAYAPLINDEGRGAQASEVIAQLSVPLLGLQGKADEMVDEAQAVEAHRLQPRSQWAFYPAGGHGFLDVSGDGYDETITADAVARLVAFFRGALVSPSRVPALEAG